MTTAEVGPWGQLSSKANSCHQGIRVKTSTLAVITMHLYVF